MTFYRSRAVAAGSGCMLHRMHYYPKDSAVLTRPSEPVTLVDDKFMESVGEMISLARFHRGYAVAAPQVGIHQRFFVFDESYARSFGLPSNLIINPVIVAAAGNERMEESCLSLPELRGWMDRPNEIRLHFWTVEAEAVKHEHEQTFTGLPARIVQHEIDHLNGELFHAKLDPSYSDKIKRYFNKRANP